MIRGIVAYFNVFLEIDLPIRALRNSQINAVLECHLYYPNIDGHI